METKYRISYQIVGDLTFTKHTAIITYDQYEEMKNDDRYFNVISESALIH